MSTNQLAMEMSGDCPICSAAITAQGVEESEILTCPECQSKLVVDGRRDQRLILNEAPLIEED